MTALDIDSMRALTVIAECGGITRAAKRLNKSEPSQPVAQTVLYALQQPEHVEIAQLVVLPVS
jgi:NADP-dependent 3-hydroxy acid dehydrogenase YdfG